jgi:hypothetical protein
MFMENIEKSHANHKRTRGYQLLPLFVAFVFALTICPTKAQAQVIGDLEVNVPFQFHAGNTRLPPGKYVIHVLDNSELTLMEISSADDSTSALFEVHAAQASSAPAKSELIFNKYGNRYFLAKVFDEGEPSGSEVFESPYEKRTSKTGAEAQEHVPAQHQQRAGN